MTEWRYQGLHYIKFISCYLLLLEFGIGNLFLKDDMNSSTAYCPNNHFRVHSGDKCHPLLSCRDINSFEMKDELPVGYVKRLFIAYWNELKVVYSIPRYNSTKSDFLHGLDMLQTFQNTPYVVEMIGYCTDEESPYLATKFYKYSSADKLKNLLDTLSLSPMKEFRVRVTLALDYLSILVFLHDSSHVMCDSNDLKKTLSQFIITDHMHLVLLDVDALPEVIRNKNITIKCGHKQLFGTFVAPEQLWPYKNEVFIDSKMPGYDEKTDIWKIPDVIRFILGQSNQATQLKFRLFEILHRCKEMEPMFRPHARDVRDAFIDAVDKLHWKVEL